MIDNHDAEHDSLIEMRIELRHATERISKLETHDESTWGIYTTGRIVLPLLLALQPVLIVVGVWLIRELSS